MLRFLLAFLLFSGTLSSLVNVDGIFCEPPYYLPVFLSLCIFSTNPHLISKWNVGHVNGGSLIGAVAWNSWLFVWKVYNLDSSSWNSDIEETCKHITHTWILWIADFAIPQLLKLWCLCLTGQCNRPDCFIIQREQYFLSSLEPFVCSHITMISCHNQGRLSAEKKKAQLHCFSATRLRWRWIMLQINIDIALLECSKYFTFIISTIHTTTP